MTYINNFGKNYAEEYKNFGETIIAENEQILKKSGITLPVFKQDSPINNPIEGLTIEHQNTTKKEEKQKKDSEKSYTATSISGNETIRTVKNSSGMLNTAYKNGIRYNATLSNNNSDNAIVVDEFISSLEETNGNDDNDDFQEFMSTDYKQGVHLNGGGYTYYENGKSAKKQAVNANVSGSYKSKNSKLTISYGGAFEYENTTIKNEDDKDTKKDLSAILMSKYKADKITYASGGTAFVYDKETQLYNIYTGFVHNASGISATLIRKIQVAKDESGKRVVNNKTDVKLNIIKPKSAGDFPNVIPNIPSPDKPKEAESLVESEKQEVNNIVTQDGEYGFGMDLEMSTSSESDEYGVVLKHSSLLSKKENKNQKICVTPFLGVYDYHPNSQEGLKVQIGAEGDLNITTDNKTNIHSTAIIDNKRIMQNGSHPVNTFMAILDTSVSKNKFSATVSTGYINSDFCVKYAFLTGSVEYKMKNSSLSLQAGYQDLILDSDKDNIFHAGLRYAVTF